MMNQDLRSKTEKILTAYGVKKAAVFGSYARGSQSKDSDIDILVELKHPLSLLDFVGLKQSLEDKLGFSVDLVQYKQLKPSLRNFILRDEVVFFQI